MADPLINNWEGFEEFIRPILWKTAPKQEKPIVFIAEEAGATLEIRINEFPVEPLYSLLKNGTVLLHFDDWPVVWGELPDFPG